MDVLRIYETYGVDYLTEGHRHCRPGWVNTVCPFCSGNEGMHLGWNIHEDYFRCWRCGPKPPVKALSAILGMPSREVFVLIKNYGVLRSYVKQLPKGKKEFLLPTGLTKLKDIHKRYLKNRRFSPAKLSKVWGVKGTSPMSYVDIYDYRFRLFIPINWNAELVTFDTRDITNLAESKYKACPVDREVIERKSILYGNQEAWGDTGICVEGPTDVWRLGESAFAVSGIAYKQEQVREMAKIFKKVAVVFDDEPQARKQAKKLVKDLQFKNVDAYTVLIKGDPGAMPAHEANTLVKNILNKK